MTLLTSCYTRSGFKFSQLEMSGCHRDRPYTLANSLLLHRRGCSVPAAIEVRLCSIGQEGPVEPIRRPLPDCWQRPEAMYASESGVVQGARTCLDNDSSPLVLLKVPLSRDGLGAYPSEFCNNSSNRQRRELRVSRAKWSPA